MAKQRPSETPLMRQFLEVKDRYPEAIVFFRLGDFYEMFFDDAVIAAKVLDLTLTSRDKGHAEAVPMCGVPHHSARGYIARLTQQGHRVVICEQVEDPKAARGLVRREVVRVVTPGVQLDEEALDSKAPAYVAAISPTTIAGVPNTKGLEGTAGAVGLAYLDVTTGEFRCCEVVGWAALATEVARIAPREILCDRNVKVEAATAIAELRRVVAAPWTEVSPMAEAEAIETLGAAGLAAPVAGPEATRAAGMVLHYAAATQPAGRLPVTVLESCAVDSVMGLDPTAIANLEIVETLIGRERRGSLLAAMDETVTAPGGRYLRRWLLFPLLDPIAIRRRQDGIEALVTVPSRRRDLRKTLGQLYDLERLVGRATLGVMGPRDLSQLRKSLTELPTLASLLAAGADASSDKAAILSPGQLQVPALAALHAMLAEALVDDPPATVKDGGVVRAGFDAAIDECRALAGGGKEAIVAIEARERSACGISSLKVGFNRVFGYYIEVTKSQLSKVPASYVRKQTVAGGERFITPELAELERKILAAEETVLARETEIVRSLVSEVAARSKELLGAAHRLAEVDVCAALAEVAHSRGYVRPRVDDSLVLEIVDGRHPVVETLLPAGAFVPNSARLDPDRQQLLLITGPNMAGKSTYMRQVAHIVLLAQAGSFVPAASARVGVCDRLFTRVGAADNLARGDSTFMVEMRETAAILAGATRRSLIVLDEVGRGTSTYDGLSIAWAVGEDLHDRIGARTLFATHYHELVEIGATRPRVVNLTAAVRQERGEIVFLRQIVEGACDRSYGIDVAKLAGLPAAVVARARELQAKLEGAPLPLVSGACIGVGTGEGASSERNALAHMLADELTGRLTAIDPNHLTPMAALALVAELRQLAAVA